MCPAAAVAAHLIVCWGTRRMGVPGAFRPTSQSHPEAAGPLHSSRQWPRRSLLAQHGTPLTGASSLRTLRSCGPSYFRITAVWDSSWRRRWQPTPVLLLGKSPGRRGLVGCRLWGRRVGHDWSDLAAAAAETHPTPPPSFPSLFRGVKIASLSEDSVYWGSFFFLIIQIFIRELSSLLSTY